MKKKGNGEELLLSLVLAAMIMGVSAVFILTMRALDGA